MFYFLTFLWCLPSPVIWVLNAEAWVVAQAIRGVDLPVLMAACAATAQTITFCGLYFGGHLVLKRLPRIRSRLERFDIEKYRRYKVAGYGAIAVGAVVGFPPLVLLSLVARSLGIHFGWFLALCLTGRMGRFLILALAPETFRSLFGSASG